MNLVGTIAVARDILEQIRSQHTFGWPESSPVPRIELEDCARHFEMDRGKWAKVCERSSGFYSRQAYARYDPTDRVDAQQRYDRAAEAIAAGTAARRIGAAQPYADAADHRRSRGE